jgi:hypothetical protein
MKNIKKEWIFVFIFLLSVITFPRLVFASTDHLVISQFQTTGGAGKTGNDFIEIYNPTSTDIDLKGYRLVKRTKVAATDTLIKSWSDSIIIKAHGFYLWANSNYTDISITPDIKTTGTIADDNGIALRQGANDTGALIDSVGWGLASNGFVEGTGLLNLTANQSYERKPTGETGNNEDTNNNFSDFILQTISHPRNFSSPIVPAVTSGAPSADTETETPSEPSPSPSEGSEGTGPIFEPVYSPYIQITEIFVNPDGSDDGEEWVEIYNNSNLDVDLKDWQIDDEGTTDEAGASAYKISESLVIKSFTYLAVNIPEKSFALNNTGGDSVRIFWPNGKLQSQVNYLEAVKEDTSYALNADSKYYWTKIVTKGFVNSFNDLAEQITKPASKPEDGNLKITEIYPNPPGPDGGAEWIEVVNSGSVPIYMHQWIIDDGASQDPVGSSNYQIQSPTINPGEYVQIIIPAGNFALNNSGAETVRIFSPTKVLIDSVMYSDAKEGMSYSKTQAGWVWQIPTPNLSNSSSLEVNAADNESKIIDIQINEVFPYPKNSATEEFIEFFNPTGQDIDLIGFTISDAASSYKIKSGTIKAGSFLVIYKSTSSLSFNNKGVESITLKDQVGNILASLEYEDPQANQSYNRTTEGAYAWSTALTPDKINEFSTVIQAVSLDGKVLGAAKTLPRTGRAKSKPDGFLISFAIFVLLWYSYVRHYLKENI